MNAYERGRSDAFEGAHVRSDEEDYLRGYAEGIIGIPGSPSMDVHVARGDAWAGRPPSRTDAAYLSAYKQEIQECLDRTPHTDEWYRRVGMKDAVRRIPPKCTYMLTYLRGYAEAAAVLLSVPPTRLLPPAPAHVPAPPPEADGSRFALLETD